MRPEDMQRLEEGLKRVERDSKRRTLYHLTSKSNLDSIRRHGLLPSSKRTSGLGLGEPVFEDVEGLVFLGRNRKECLDQLRINRTIGLWTPKTRDMVLLRVSLPEGYEVSRDDSGFLYVDRPVPPEYITILS